jgi:hypothetical protein
MVRCEPVPDEPRASASPLYAMGQLGRAIDSLAAAQDPGDRKRLEAKISRWRSVLTGMADGTLTVGSRTPVAGTPAWVTPEVAPGGFASGALVAESPPDAREQAILAGLGDTAPGSTDRERLNLWYLTDAGQERLRQDLADGRCRVEVPEDAALPVICWLLDQRRYEAALDLVSELRPWMHRLRFAAPAASAASAGAAPGALVHIRTAGQVAAALRARETRPRIAVMAETLLVWHPLFDRLADLWCDTVEGDLPHLTAAADGSFAVSGGWPCRRWPADWAQRRSAWLADYSAAADGHPLARGHQSPKSNFSRLRQALERCPADSSSLAGRDVGWIRRSLANTVSRRGAPGSAERTALRSAQARLASRPSHEDLAAILADRIDRFPAEGGIPSADSIAGAVAPAESPAVPPGHPMPPHLIGKAERAVDAPVQDLVERGIIGSADVLADVLPQITAQVLAADFDDPALGVLHGQAYAAFRRRRSLLLLNLEHQVRFGELPWIAAIRPGQAGRADAGRAARQTLEQVTLLAITGFPQAILPNTLIAEMAVLAQRAGLSVPLVEEVAADIFTGTFTEKWRLAAAAASEHMAGTLYARYYDLPGPGTWAAPPAAQPARRGRRWGRKVAGDFAALCAARAGAQAQPSDAPASYAAVNGTILEQAQILTTHNLATLTGALDLRDHLTALAPQLADRAFAWLVRRLRQQPDDWHARLQAVKNAAYAWRQAIYFLSLCEEAAQAEALARLRAASDGLTGFAPAVDGLAHVMGGGQFDASGRAPGSGRQFLGWTTGLHWALLAGEPGAPDLPVSRR